MSLQGRGENGSASGACEVPARHEPLGRSGTTICQPNFKVRDTSPHWHGSVGHDALFPTRFPLCVMTSPGPSDRIRRVGALWPAIAYSKVSTGRTPSAVPSSSNFPASHLGSEPGLIVQSYRAFHLRHVAGSTRAARPAPSPPAKTDHRPTNIRVRTLWLEASGVAALAPSPS
jgi:hypothetical protein